MLGQQVLPDGEHLGADVGRESVHLLAVLLHLLRVEHALQPAGLLGELEQPLPLVLGQRCLLGRRARRVLRLALGLPLRDLGLLTAELALVELKVVEVGVVRLDALEQEVASLLEEGVYRQVEVVDRGVQRLLDGVFAQVRQRSGGLDLVLLGDLGQLVQERRQEVGVVDFDGELGENILEGQLGLLQAVAVTCVSKRDIAVKFARCSISYLSVVNLFSL